MKTQDVQHQITRKTLILAFLILVIILLFIPGKKEASLGLIYGTAINLLNFRLLEITLRKSVTKPPEKARIYVTSRYILRFFIVFVALYVAIKSPALNFLAAALGFLLIKFVIVFGAIFENFNWFRKRNS